VDQQHLPEHALPCLPRSLMAEIGTKRTNEAGLAMPVLEGKADFPVAYRDFSV